MKQKKEKIAVVGAGLVGSLVAIYLAKRGYGVDLYERRHDMRRSGAEGGRSINLALSNRGLLPLSEVGLGEAAKKMVIPMRGRMMHSEKGALTFQAYGREDQAINSISRGGLNELLMNEAEKNGVNIHFNHRCTDIDFDNSKLFFDIDGAQKTETADIIIGADGAFSVVRGIMQKTDRFNFSQHYIEHGYKELSIPPDADGNFKLEKNALHIWPRGNYMLIALPNLDGSFTCTLFFPFEGDPSFEKLRTLQDVDQFFKATFPDARELMTTLLEDYQQNPTSSLVTVKSYPWVKNKTLIIGDASHAIVPFYGQGMNSGFEDCRILNQILDQYSDDWKTTLQVFSNTRKIDADAISDLALQNFVEMRDLVADKDFLLRKKIEAKLHELFPDRWIPLYSMVTFNEGIRYSEAMKIGKKQQAIMDQVMKTPDIHQKWELLDFRSIVDMLEV
ncbi:Kynurenine 3-monooxygenase [Fulvivirga imtechensis AK7]|uniref:Kynurenine 3-monooxygenase n=1 Tax=Fulvivirga imtechensis AK7 TaxID=1237149 RepID=L8JTS9_9BACT|nr:NAD(P)/FAD-dependent oxidoreductase [Fulvivirga imtechensis]ELR70939.1 Kynurenine 3-monooxygenase [Fulvivirga imtechensis AK7]